MGSSLIGALRVSLGLDTAQFEAGSKRSRAEAKSLGSALQSSVAGGAGKANAALGLLGVSLTAGAAISAAKRALEYASSLSEVSQQLGVVSKDLQIYRYAASQVGISQEDMDKGLAKLTLSIGQASAGSSKQATTFRELGVSVEDANGRVKTAGEVIPRLADALSKVKDPATRARLEVDLFGKTGQRLDTLLAGGSSAIDELRKAAEDLGIVLSEKQIQDADKTADKLAEVKKVLEARLAGVVADNVSAILTLADAFESVVGHAGEAIRLLKLFNAYRERFREQSTEVILNGLTLGGALGGGDRIARSVQRKREYQGIIDRGGRDPSKGAAPPPQPKTVPDGDLPVDASAAKAAARAAEQQRRQALQREDRYQSDLARTEDELLGLKQQLTTDVREQASYQHDQVDLAAKQREKALQLDVQQGQINAAAAADIAAREAANDELKHAQINRELDAKLAQQALDVTTADLANRQDVLTAQANLARTAGERRDIEVRLLDLQFDEEKARLEAVLASRESTEAEKQIAQARLDLLGKLKGSAQEGVRRGTMGPAETYLASVYKTAGEQAEQFEASAVDGLKSLEDQLTSTAAGVLKLGGVFGSVANSIISDLIRIGIQQNITGPLAKLLFPGSSSGGGAGGLFSSIGSLFGGGGFNAGAATASIMPGLTNPSIPHWAKGGTGTITGFRGIDNNTLSLNGSPIARVSHGERLTVSPHNDNGGMLVVQVDKSPLFDVHVQRAAAPLAQAAVVGGANLARSQSARASRRRL